MKFKAYIEALGNDKDFLKKFLEETEKKIKEFNGIFIENSRIDEPVEREVEINNQKTKIWSSYLEIDGKFDDIESLIDFILQYSPSRIEVEDIKEVKFVTNNGEIRISKERFNNILNSISYKIIELSRMIGSLIITNKILEDTIKKMKK